MQYSYAGQRRISTRSMAGIGVVIALHILLVYALVNGLARKVVEVIRPPIETKIIEPAKPPQLAPPPPPPPKLVAPPPPYTPPPEVLVQTPPPQQTIAVTTTVKPAEPTPAAPPAPVEAPKPSVIVPPVIDAKHSCTLPEYPPAARRLELTGAVVLRFLIDTDGHVIDSQVQTSSGHAELDDAAREALSRCQFKPGTADGKPQQSWAKLKYVWRLQ